MGHLWKALPGCWSRPLPTRWETDETLRVWPFVHRKNTGRKRWEREQERSESLRNWETKPNSDQEMFFGTALWLSESWPGFSCYYKHHRLLTGPWDHLGDWLKYISLHDPMLTGEDGGGRNPPPLLCKTQKHLAFGKEHFLHNRYNREKVVDCVFTGRFTVRWAVQTTMAF